MEQALKILRDELKAAMMLSGTLHTIAESIMIMIFIYPNRVYKLKQCQPRSSGSSFSLQLHSTLKEEEVVMLLFADDCICVIPFDFCIDRSSH